MFNPVVIIDGRGEFPAPKEGQKTFTKRVFHRITKKAQKYETIGNYDCHRVLKSLELNLH